MNSRERNFWATRRASWRSFGWLSRTRRRLLHLFSILHTFLWICYRHVSKRFILYNVQKSFNQKLIWCKISNRTKKQSESQTTFNTYFHKKKSEKLLKYISFILVCQQKWTHKKVHASFLNVGKRLRCANKTRKHLCYLGRPCETNNFPNETSQRRNATRTWRSFFFGPINEYVTK